MKPPLAIRVMSMLTANTAALISELRLLTPSATQWAQIDAAYAFAQAHHEFIGILVAEEFADMRGTRCDAWLRAPGTLHALATVMVAGLLIYLCSASLQRRSNP
jgi:hypothetical protein